MPSSSACNFNWPDLLNVAWQSGSKSLLRQYALEHLDSLRQRAFCSLVVIKSELKIFWCESLLLLCYTLVAVSLLDKNIPWAASRGALCHILINDSRGFEDETLQTAHSGIVCTCLKLQSNQVCKSSGGTMHSRLIVFKTACEMTRPSVHN